MLGVCFFILCAASVLAAALNGSMPSLSNAALDGAAEAVRLVLSLAGTMALWCGVMNVLREAGVTQRLSRLLAPVLRLVFPDAWRDKTACAEITAALSANILGIGNAATPLALAAMGKLQARNPTPDTATDDMITLAVLATSSLDILPTTLLALRRAAGSAAPYAVIVPIWLTSSVCCLCAVLLCRAQAWARRAGRRA
ncbi:MAG: nucleoside recognition domain-containing protein [Eubacteriales bacterium]